MKCEIVIDMENAAFSDEEGGSCGRECARILRKLAERIDCHTHFSSGHSQPLHDINGNEVGFCDVKEA